MSRDPMQFRPIDETQERQVNDLARLLTGGNRSRLVRLAVTELIEKHSKLLEENAVHLQAIAQAEAALQSAASQAG